LPRNITLFRGDEIMPPSGDSAVKQAMSIFCSQHKILLGEFYLVQWGKDQKIMKEIVDLYGIPKTFALISLFYQELLKDEFLKKTGATVGIFKTQIPKLLLKLNERKDKEQIGRL